MLILEANKGFSDEVSYVKQDTVITCILFIKYNLTIIQELNLLRD